jgi:hypothetical protein
MAGSHLDAPAIRLNELMKHRHRPGKRFGALSARGDDPHSPKVFDIRRLLECVGGETIELQQQVARLQALLEASRQVHSTIREEEVLESVLRIVVRELEMAGAAFPRSAGLRRREGRPRQHRFGDSQSTFPLADRDGNA